MNTKNCLRGVTKHESLINQERKKRIAGYNLFFWFAKIFDYEDLITKAFQNGCGKKNFHCKIEIIISLPDSSAEDNFHKQGKFLIANFLKKMLYFYINAYFPIGQSIFNKL